MKTPGNKAPRKNAQVPTCLDDLRLTKEDLAELAHQGFVRAEYRGDRGPFFKLRFRINGRQSVRYLGMDAGVAQRVQQLIMKVQAVHRAERAMAQVCQEVSQALRQSKVTLRPTLELAGYKFHGFAVRRSREQRS